MCIRDRCNGDSTSCLDNIISLGAATESSLEVLYSSSSDIGGFQFAVSGVNVSGAYGGAAEDAGFTVSAGSEAILGFSFDGNSIPAGTGVLTNLDIVVTDFEACLSGVVVSSPDAQALDFETGGCVDLPCNDEDGDSVCDGIDDCVGEYDDCGVCNGGNADQDCNGDCFGDAFVDSCGVCSEGNSGHTADSDIDCHGDCFGDATVDGCEVCGGDDSSCAAPTDLSATGLRGEVALSWTANDAASSYNIYRDGELVGTTSNTTYMDPDGAGFGLGYSTCLLYTSPSPRDS